MFIPFAIAIRIFRQLTNDRRTIGMIIIVPIIITVIFGYAFTGETYNNPIIIVNLDESTFLTRSLGDRVVEKLENDDRVKIFDKLNNYTLAKEFVLNRTVTGIIFLPQNLSNSLNPMLNISVTIEIFYDEAEPAIGGSILGALSEAFAESSNDIREETGLSSLTTIQRVFAWGSEEIKGLDVTLPGIIGYISLFLIILLTVLLSVREDLEGTKARFFSAPINRWQVMLGYLIGMTIFGVLISAIVLLVSLLVFNAEVRGDLVLVFGFALYFAMGSVMLALFLARVARNEFQAVQMAVIVAIPSIALSGFMVPINTLPSWLRIFSNLIPLTYAVSGLKSLMLRGLGLEDIAVELLALTIYIILAFLGAVFASRETVA